MDFTPSAIVTEDSSVAAPEQGLGYVERDYSEFSEGYYAPMFTGPSHPRSEWPELIKMQNEFKTSPYHVHKMNDCPILSQRSLPYCWMYGTVAGVMNRYAATGIKPPHLSATGPAAQGKGWSKRGGWAGEALGYIERFGIPTVDAWPNTSMDRSLPNKEEVKRSSAMHKHAEFEELPSRNFDLLCSALLDPEDPCPVTLGLNWWGHLVVALRVVQQGSSFLIEIANSWGTQWQNGGYGLLTQSKATAHEQIAIRRVVPRIGD